MDVLAITIEGGGIAVRLGPPGGAPGLHVSGLAGWYGTPDGKWDLTERQLGDGAFAIEPSRVAYSSRTVTVDGYALGRTMAEALSWPRRTRPERSPPRSARGFAEGQ